MKAKLKQTHKKQLENAVKNLNRIINAIRTYMPDANLFIHGEGIVSLLVHEKDIVKVGDDEWYESRCYYAGDIKYCDCGGY